jgi:hypothetical protein
MSMGLKDVARSWVIAAVMPPGTRVLGMARDPLGEGVVLTTTDGVYLLSGAPSAPVPERMGTGVARHAPTTDAQAACMMARLRECPRDVIRRVRP